MVFIAKFCKIFPNRQFKGFLEIMLLFLKIINKLMKAMYLILSSLFFLTSIPKYSPYFGKRQKYIKHLLFKTF